MRTQSKCKVNVTANLVTETHADFVLRAAPIHVDQFLDGVHTFDLHPSTHTKHDGIPLADVPVDILKLIGIASPPSLSYGQDARFPVQTDCHS
jgi:hypothetical protein